jgi:hypothetical protein
MVKAQQWIHVKKGTIWMNDICMKIVGMETKNVILQIQNKWLDILLYFHF